MTVIENKLKLFPDATNLFLYNPTLSELQAKCNSILQAMQTWFASNKISLLIIRYFHFKQDHAM